MSKILTSAMIIVALTLAAPPASSHAFLARSAPPAGSTMSASPDTVTITYTESVEPNFSTIEVRAATGTRVDKADLHVTGGAGRQLSVGLPPLPPGQYTVVWHVTSVDTHKTEGNFDFTISP
jgi:methionine-rich copper-binding protein CopC